MRSPQVGAWIGSLALVVACVVVPPRGAPQPPPRQPPPTVGDGQYGGATYGVNNCTGAYGGASYGAGYGGATYGGRSCSSWLWTGDQPGVAPPNALRVEALVCTGSGASAACNPAIGASITLTASSGASSVGKTDGIGQFVVPGIAQGPHRILVEYLGVALPGVVTVDSSVSKFGKHVTVWISPNDFR